MFRISLLIICLLFSSSGRLFSQSHIVGLNFSGANYYNIETMLGDKNLPSYNDVKFEFGLYYKYINEKGRGILVDFAPKVNQFAFYDTPTLTAVYQRNEFISTLVGYLQSYPITSHLVFENITGINFDISFYRQFYTSQPFILPAIYLDLQKEKLYKMGFNGQYSLGISPKQNYYINLGMLLNIDLLIINDELKNNRTINLAPILSIGYKI